MQLKINIHPAFSNECSIEFKQQGDFIDLIIILSAYTEIADNGKSYYCRIQDKKVVAALIINLFRIIDKPSPKTQITINDGIVVSIAYADENKAIDYTLSSIQTASIEVDFLHVLFDYCLALLKEESLKLYFDGIKKDFL